MTATEQSISPGTAGLQHVRVIAYPLGEYSSLAVMVSTKAKEEGRLRLALFFVWRSHAQGAISPIGLYGHEVLNG
jgi:hypothetical protein